ncbi:MAG: phosphate signaling complex protein PhoU [Planctomycetota bacterium]|nr:phosphate signaling complex protein PhoU [Planctomycetota bacterium]
MPSLTAELTTLRRLLLTMGAEVEQRVDHAFDALLKHDLRLAERVRDTDDDVDALDLNVESECAAILALHQPVAGDLRYVMAALRINADLERAADLARGVAKRAIKLEYGRPFERPAALGEMAHSIRAMVSDCLGALADMDTARAYRVRLSDKQVDKQYKSLMRWALAQIEAQTIDPKSLLDIIAIMRSMERIADLCTNVAESVVFAADGLVVRHSPVEATPESDVA